MSNPKYSVVLPTLNGFSTLETTLPAMLREARDDVEFVVSDNCSEDRTWELLNSFNDRRLRPVRPESRMKMSDHLDFAYSHACGEWQGHFGDDDYLLPDRWDILDRAIEDESVDVVQGDFVRYTWPTSDPELASNCISPKLFRPRVIELPGREAFQFQINRRLLPGGGSWVVRRSVIEKVRRRCGFFSSSQHVEFFSMRAACLNARVVRIIPEAIWIIGRHEKSAGSQGIHKRKSATTSFDWNKEDPARWKYCPWNFKTYATQSLDGALTAKALFDAADVDVDWGYWIFETRSDMAPMIRRGHLPADSYLAHLRGAATILASHPGSIGQLFRQARARWSRRGSRKRRPLKDMLPSAPPWSTELIAGWTKNIFGAQAGFVDIISAAKWFEQSPYHGILDS